MILGTLNEILSRTRRRLSKAWIEKSPAFLLSNAARIAFAHELIGDLQFSRADDFIEKCLRARPDDRQLMLAHAFSAHNSGRFSDAVIRWNALQARDPENPFAWSGAASNLRELGHVDQARVEIEDALSRFPDDLIAITEAIRIADRQGRDETALSLWKRASELEPNDIKWTAGVFARLLNQSRVDEAVVFAEGLDVARDAFSPILRALAGLSALRRDDWVSARDLIDPASILAAAKEYPWLLRTIANESWLRLPRLSSLLYLELKAAGHDDVDLLHRLVEVLILSGEMVRAGVELAAALDRYPDNLWLHYDRAHLDWKLERFDEAIAGFRAVLARAPHHQRAREGLSQARMDKAYVDTHAGNAHVELDVMRQDVGHVDDDEVRDLLLGFESVGQDCEFGLVQRRFGAEPLGLLRWNFVRPEVLRRAIDVSFEGLGLPANTELGLWAGYEYYLTDTRWEFGFHTWISQHEMARDDVFAKMCKRVIFLREKFLADLVSAEKIFVCKSDVASADDIRALLASMRTHGPVTLLWVRALEHLPPNTDARAGDVVVLEEGLIVGYLNRYGNRGFVSWEIPFDEWIAICRIAAGYRATTTFSPSAA